MSRLVLAVLGLAVGLLLVRTEPAFAERRVALVIGNSAYQNAPALTDPRRDAEAMAATFRSAGFDVVSAQYDLGSAQFKQAVAQFETAAAGSDIAAVYFSGYGIDVQGVNYLIPVDAKLASEQDVADRAMTLDQLAKAAEGAARLRLVILDASRADPFARSINQQSTAQAVMPGLAEVTPNNGTLIAYAAKAGSLSEDGNSEHSTYTAALLRNLFAPGLDIRLAFGRVLVDVLRVTGNRQEPFVYGSLAGRNIALVPAPANRPGVDLHGEKIDYSVVEKTGTAHAWEVFLVQHPTGFYSSAARAELRLAEAELPPASPTPVPAPPLAPPVSPLPPSGPTAELQPPGSVVPPAVERPDLVRLAQMELTRLGCFSGVPDGALNDATKAAIQAYRKALGEKPIGDDVEITGVFVGELRQQTVRVCPLVCPNSQVAVGEQCVDAAKAKAIAHQKEKDQSARPVARPRPEAPPPPRITQQTPAAHPGVMPGVGF
ncbi:MAG TPA: caspase family protein [Xanthobacteraceae bacterium]|nr:caspase family protein [Xanthobacteraceae bacterium]